MRISGARRPTLSLVLSAAFMPAAFMTGSAGLGYTFGQSDASAVAPGAATSETTALPDIGPLMLTVESRQKAAEEARKDYIFHEVETDQELDSHGGVKKTEVNEYDEFWIDGVPVRKQVTKDGKPLTADEARKESERIDKEVAKARERRAKEDAKGKQTDPMGNDEVTVSRLLELGSFTNPRRVLMGGRETIAVDYTGDPKAKTKAPLENVIRDMTGTVWVDEKDKAVARIEGRFVDSFKVGGGLVASIQQGTNFTVQLMKVNGEVWLPTRAEGHGEARFLLFFKFNGSLTIVDSDYRKFKTSSTILPAQAAAPDAARPNTESPADAPKQ